MSADDAPHVSGAGRLDLDDYDYTLPPERIAQHPLPERDAGRLLVVDRRRADFEHRSVSDLPCLLDPGDLLVVNATRVLPARLRGRKPSGGAVEALLLGPESGGDARHRALFRGRARPGLRIRFEGGGAAVEAEIVEVCERGEVVLAFEPGVSPYAVGEVPLPPYIQREAPCAEDAERYQTTFARVPGAVAAPTAGLHLSERLLEALSARGIGRAEIVLHVGPGTFRPLGERELAAGRLHSERYELCEESADRIVRTRAEGRRVVAVGTTSARVLEACADPEGHVRAAAGETDLFLRPGSRFLATDALLTNFHLPRSSLLLLVAGFAGRERVLAAYAEAIACGYRFYSYGDAMLIC